jgi:hypothetical protein
MVGADEKVEIFIFSMLVIATAKNNLPWAVIAIVWCIFHFPLLYYDIDDNAKKFEVCVQNVCFNINGDSNEDEVY